MRPGRLLGRSAIHRAFALHLGGPIHWTFDLVCSLVTRQFGVGGCLCLLGSDLVFVAEPGAFHFGGHADGGDATAATAQEEEAEGEEQDGSDDTADDDAGGGDDGGDVGVAGPAVGGAVGDGSCSWTGEQETPAKTC